MTGISALTAMYFLLPPAGLAVTEIADQLSLGVFAATGGVIAVLNHRLRVAEEHQRRTTAMATVRAERLDAILNTTVDGVIVIDAKGTIEAFNPGAQGLFGYPESEVIGRNVSLLMPSPEHEEHDEYLQRYLTTGEAKINGGHAMKGKGRIRVAVDTIDSTCQVAFSDGGPGIPLEIREKIFTPFFTTKARGSGLGLPTAKRFIEAHNGQIAIDCPPAGGTTVVIRLPMSPASGSTRARAEARA